MPSAEETTYLIEVMPGDSGEALGSQDVDVLVSRIKENLRLSNLKANKASSVLSSHKPRPTPYRIPVTKSGCDYCGLHRLSSSDNHNKKSCQLLPNILDHHYHHQALYDIDELDDSYERFQALLRSGALIKEAVKRLRTGLKDHQFNIYHGEDSENIDIDNENTDIFLDRRKKHFYDEDDEELPIEL